MCDLLSICGGHPDPWNQTWWYISSDRLSEDILILGTKLDDQTWWYISSDRLSEDILILGTKLDDILVVTDYLRTSWSLEPNLWYISSERLSIKEVWYEGLRRS